MPRNDDLSLILAKAKLNGMLPDVKNEELDAIQQYANVLFSDDAALSAIYGRNPRLGIASPSAAEKRRYQIPSVMATPPTVTFGAAFGASSITNAVAVPITDSRLRFTGAAMDAGTAGSNGTIYYQGQITGGSAPFRLEFDLDSQVIEFDMMRNAVVQILVDGQLIGPTPQTVTVAGASQYYMKVDFGLRKPRRIVAYIGNQVSRIMIGPNDTLWKTTTPATPRIRAISDSVGQTANNVVVSGGPYQLAASMLGWDDFEISAIGGTGFLNNNSGGYTTFRQRIVADVLNRSPEIIGIFGGINDQGRQAKSVLQAEITTLVSQCRTSAPNALILGGGPWQPKGSLATSQNYIDVRDAFLASMQTITGPWVFVDPLTGGWTASNGKTGVSTTPWITGEGTTGAVTGSGNADLYISDGTHPNAAGATYAANRLASSISAALESF